MIVSAVTLLTTIPFASICDGFAVPTTGTGTNTIQHHHHHPAQRFRRNLPTLHFQEDDNIVPTPPTKDLVNALLVGDVVPLLGGDTNDFVTHDDDADEVGSPTPLHPTTASLRPLSFEDDIQPFLDITRPYYALANEHAIVDDITEEIVGFLCTGRIEIPSTCENSDISWAEAGRQTGAAGAVTALLHNPQKKRFYYPASQYHCDVHPTTGRVEEEVTKLLGSYPFAPTDDPVILVRCNNFSKRTANCQVLLEHGDATWELNINFSVISGSVFEKMNPPRQSLHKSTTTTPYARISYESLATLENIKSFSDLTGEWLTMEGTMPPCKTSDCQGHFHNNPTLPHSFMLIPNVDLIGRTISEFTGVSLNEAGIEMLAWTALPEVLHFPDTCGLKFQCKVFLGKGELGQFGSTYRVESVVKQETGVLIYRASGEFVLQSNTEQKPKSWPTTTITNIDDKDGTAITKLENGCSIVIDTDNINCNGDLSFEQLSNKFDA